ncbi:MAG: purine phosphorylase [Rhodospirillales bacterium]|nr:purine phosphorylase [Rhodospirillales bacterium]
MRIGVVVGLRSEAACLSDPSIDDRRIVCCSGARPAEAARLAERLIDEGCDGLVSFGMAGGLDPVLAPGALIVADSVLGADGTALSTDTGWRQRLLARIRSNHLFSNRDHPEPVTGRVLAAVEPILSPRIKDYCHKTTQAIAVDMESGEVGRIAQAANRPFLVVRAVADASTRSVPAWVIRTVTADGTTSLPAFLRGLARHPADVRLLYSLARDSRAALRSLSGVALRVGPLFNLNG